MLEESVNQLLFFTNCLYVHRVRVCVAPIVERDVGKAQVLHKIYQFLAGKGLVVGMPVKRAYLCCPVVDMHVSELRLSVRIPIHIADDQASP